MGQIESFNTLFLVSTKWTPHSPGLWHRHNCADILRWLHLCCFLPILPIPYLWFPIRSCLCLPCLCHLCLLVPPCSHLRQRSSSQNKGESQQHQSQASVFFVMFSASILILHTRLYITNINNNDVAVDRRLLDDSHVGEAIVQWQALDLPR